MIKTVVKFIKEVGIEHLPMITICTCLVWIIVNSY